MKKAIFITNEIYVDKTLPEGGVQYCTDEYLKLLTQKFDLSIFKIKNKKSIFYRILVKMGINQYKDFSVEYYKDSLIELIQNQKIDFVFLNQSNTAAFAQCLKTNLTHPIKIFICSHGNESGDLLHEFTKFQEELPTYKKTFSKYIFGSVIFKEVEFRNKFIDGVLTVSEVEREIENWLGSKRVLFIPRMIDYQPVILNPKLGIVGFFGDLSHKPNFFCLKLLCEEINKLNFQNLELRIVSSSEKESKQLEKNFSFIHYLGYLTNDELRKESEHWCFFLNPVFYFSRGVSTKLGKALSYGLPVITSSIGTRGYSWNDGYLPTPANPEEMARVILELTFDLDKITFYQNQVKKIVQSTPKVSDLAKSLNDLIL